MLILQFKITRINVIILNTILCFVSKSYHKIKIPKYKIKVPQTWTNVLKYSSKLNILCYQPPPLFLYMKSVLFLSSPQWYQLALYVIWCRECTVCTQTHTSRCWNWRDCLRGSKFETRILYSIVQPFFSISLPLCPPFLKREKRGNGYCQAKWLVMEIFKSESVSCWKTEWSPGRNRSRSVAFGIYDLPSRLQAHFACQDKKRHM